MPFSYDIHAEIKLIVTRYTGHVQDREFIDTYTSIFSHKDWSLGFNELVDLRGVTYYDVTMESFQQVSGMTSEFLGSTKTRTAILSNVSLNEALIRLYAAIAENDGVERVKIFEEPTHAIQWLGISKIDFDKIDDSP